MTPMTSPVIKLARECGADPYGMMLKFTVEELERFHAKAQAQALRDAAEWFDEHETDSAMHLLRMAEELERGA